MLRNRWKIQWVLLAYLCVLPCVSAPAAGEPETTLSNPAPAPETADVPPPAISSNALYALPEHLFTASAVIYSMDGREVGGEWRQNYFAFPSFDPKAGIRLITAAGSANKRNVSVIAWNPLFRGVQRLTFYDTFPGSRNVIFYYRLEQEKPSKENNYMMLTVWAGRHLIKRLRLAPSSKGVWQKEIMDLHAASFLNKAVPLTLEIGTDPSGLLAFKFLGEIQ